MILSAIILIWGISAFFDAREENPWSWPFRMISWGLEFDGKKTPLMRTAHRSGACSIFTLLVMTSGLFMLAEKGGFWSFAACFSASGFTYWLVFDIAFAKLIGQKWHYLGSSAQTDGVVNKILGVHSGKVKAIICGGLIVSILILYNFFQ